MPSLVECKAQEGRPIMNRTNNWNVLCVTAAERAAETGKDDRRKTCSCAGAKLHFTISEQGRTVSQEGTA